MVVMFASMPLAWVGAKIEGLARERQRRHYNRLLNWARKPSDPNVPGSIILRSIFTMFAASWALFLVTILVFQQVFSFIFSSFSTLFLALNIQWPHLWIAATLGGVMALRVKRAYAILAVGIGFVLFFSILPVFAWQS